MTVRKPGWPILHDKDGYLLSAEERELKWQEEADKEREGDYLVDRDKTWDADYDTSQLPLDDEEAEE